MHGQLVGVRLHPHDRAVRRLAPAGIEITPPRAERSTGPGHRHFEIVADASVTLEEDMARRDFTVNAIARRLTTGELLDPFDGVADLERRVLRTVSDDSFREDPLRILRGLRFVSPARLHPRARDEGADAPRRRRAPPRLGRAHRRRPRRGRAGRAVEAPARPAPASRRSALARDIGALPIVIPAFADGDRLRARVGASARPARRARLRGGRRSRGLRRRRAPPRGAAPRSRQARGRPHRRQPYRGRRPHRAGDPRAPALPDPAPAGGRAPRPGARLSHRGRVGGPGAAALPRRARRRPGPSARGAQAGRPGGQDRLAARARRARGRSRTDLGASGRAPPARRPRRRRGRPDRGRPPRGPCDR